MEKIEERLDKIISESQEGGRKITEGVNREYYWEIVVNAQGQILHKDYLNIRDLINEEEYANLKQLPKVIDRIRMAYETKQFKKEKRSKSCHL